VKRYQRIVIALAIFLSGLALLPQVSLGSPTFGWEQYATAYEDVVNITRARYRDGELEVRATSTEAPAATLLVFRTLDRRYLGRLTYDPSEGEYRGDFILPVRPRLITVISNMGGRDTARVTE
jgi:hypothetical protein